MNTEKAGRKLHRIWWVKKLVKVGLYINSDLELSFWKAKTLYIIWRNVHDPAEKHGLIFCRYHQKQNLLQVQLQSLLLMSFYWLHSILVHSSHFLCWTYIMPEVHCIRLGFFSATICRWTFFPTVLSFIKTILLEIIIIYKLIQNFRGMKLQKWLKFLW